MKKAATLKKSTTDWKRVKAMTDRDIDLSAAQARNETKRDLAVSQIPKFRDKPILPLLNSVQKSRFSLLAATKNQSVKQENLQLIQRFRAMNLNASRARYRRRFDCR